MRGASMFERIVVVDWSASSTPTTGKDSIWIAELHVASGHLSTVNPPTRTAACDLLMHLASGSGRCLVGVDFSLGFPAGTADAVGLTGVPWAVTWELLAATIVDDERNANNRFEVARELNETMSSGPGPFWGCHPSRASSHLTSTKVPCDPLPEWRTVEAELRRRGMRPFSAWQLLGAGAVGSQSLVGIAAMSRLLDRLVTSGRSVDVWPFTCGLRPPEADVVLVEVWPTLVDSTTRPGDDARNGWEARVRDERQVMAVARHLRSIDLAAGFSPQVPIGTEETIVSEEGWVLGA